MKETQKISDTEFDGLFKEKLHSFETDPSDGVWKGISEQLNPERKKREFPVLWLSAASMVIMVSFGLWLSANKEPIKLRSMADRNVIAPQLAIENKPVVPGIVVVEPIKSKPVATKETAKMIEAPPPKIASLKIVPVEAVQYVEIQEPVSSPVVMEKQKPAEEVLAEKSVLAILNIPVNEATKDERQIKERISTVGGLVNFVVGKVDKRKDKIIQFEEGNEGTMVSGLNLGLLKFQTKK